MIIFLEKLLFAMVIFYLVCKQKAKTNCQLESIFIINILPF